MANHEPVEPSHPGWKKLNVRLENNEYFAKFRDTRRYGKNAEIKVVTFDKMTTRGWNTIPDVYIAIINPEYDPSGNYFEYVGMIVRNGIQIVYLLRETKAGYMFLDFGKIYPMKNFEGKFVYHFEPNILFRGMDVSRKLIELHEYAEGAGGS